MYLSRKRTVTGLPVHEASLPFCTRSFTDFLFVLDVSTRHPRPHPRDGCTYTRTHRTEVRNDPDVLTHTVVENR